MLCAGAINSAAVGLHVIEAREAHVAVCRARMSDPIDASDSSEEEEVRRRLHRAAPPKSNMCNGNCAAPDNARARAPRAQRR